MHRVLVIDDNEVDCEAVERMLRGACTVEAAYTARQGLERCETEEPACVLLDQRLPDADGLDMLPKLVERGVPVILLTGSEGGDLAAKAIRGGAYLFLQKAQLSAALLTSCVEQCVLRREKELERKKFEAERETHRAQLFGILDLLPVGVYVLDGQGVPFYANSESTRLLGKPLDRDLTPEQLPSAYQIFVEGTDRPYPGSSLPLVRALHGHFASAADLEVRPPEGPPIVLGSTAWPVRNEQGDVEYAIVAFQDITHRRKLEAQLHQAQKMEAVGRLAGGVAHDLNNLLTVIFSFGQFVLEELTPGEPAHDDMDQVLQAAESARKLTSQLLEFGAQRTVEPRVLNLAEVVADLQKMLRRILGEDVELIQHSSPDLWNVWVDPSAMEQVLVNLVVNAKDAMPHGGRLLVETGNAVLDPEYCRSHGAEVHPGEYVVLSVSDDGHGMDEATRKRIFEPFFTTKELGRGTGLGLATCYGIVKQAGGHLWVYSEVGRGTTFKVYIPRSVEEASAAEAPRGVNEALMGTETVLVVEDNAAVRALAARTLTRLGYEVLSASNGGEALLLTEEDASRRIDLLLTDVVMPKMGGKQLATRLARLRPEMKVLFMSGYTANTIVHRGVLDEGVALVHKPFNPEDLARCVRKVLDSDGHDAGALVGRPKLLVVDDDPLLLNSVRRAWSKDYEVLVASSGAVALDLMRTESFDLVLCDVVMPGMNGAEVYRTIVQEQPSLAERFVFITGHPDPSIVTKMLGAHDGRVLKKPVEQESIADLLDT